VEHLLLELPPLRLDPLGPGDVGVRADDAAEAVTRESTARSSVLQTSRLSIASPQRLLSTGRRCRTVSRLKPLAARLSRCRPSSLNERIETALKGLYARIASTAFLATSTGSSDR
jgi:hypothetical protein